MKLNCWTLALLTYLLLLPVNADNISSDQDFTNSTSQALHSQIQEMLLRVEAEGSKDTSLLHLRLAPVRSALDVVQTYSPDQGPPLMDRFYFYAYQYSANANLVAVQVPELYDQQTLVYQQIRRQNEPQMKSILRSALGRAAGEYALNQIFDRDTGNWVQAPSITAEGFRQRLRPGMQFNVRGSIRGVGAAVRYNVAGFSISSAYATQNEGMEPVRISRPFSTDDYRGEFGVDTRGNLWLNFIGRW